MIRSGWEPRGCGRTGITPYTERFPLFPEAGKF